ncbi:MAG TPA: DUF1573 domain-containing protein [Gemmataceae bacterium]|jgi:hypothetical protein|nr:DUF1573 domain-containing protein [Gemmataceae bacterium]
MLRYSLLSAVLLAAANPVHASSWADGMFEELSKDFGSVPHGTVAVHHFRLVNNTGSPVRITNVRVSCGCTSARALQTNLVPGQETSILAQMDTRRFYGTKTVTIYVQYDQPSFEEVRLSVQANSRDDLAYSPETINFGKVQHGTAATADMTVTFLGGGQIKILEAKSDSNYLLPDFKEIRRDSGEVVYQITARIRPDAPAGKWYSDVWVKTTSPAMPRLRVPLTIEIEAALIISPNAVAMGKVKAGTNIDRKVILRGATPFRIVSVDGTDDQVRVQDTNAEAKTVHVLTVTLSPTAPGPLNRTIRVHTDLETGGEIEFNAQAQVVP